MDANYSSMMTKMKKTLEYSGRQIMQGIRAGRANPHVLDKLQCGLLRNADTDSAGWQYYRSGSQNDSDCTVGEVSD